MYVSIHSAWPFLDDLDGGVRRVEDVAAPLVAAVESDRVAAIEPMNGSLQHALVERRQEVVVRRHEAEAVTDR